MSSPSKVLDSVVEHILEKLQPRIVQIFRDRVPIDTHYLQESIQGTLVKNGIDSVLTIRIKESSHPESGINTALLGMILNVGIKKGKLLLRTQTQKSNPRKTPTADWWVQAVRDVQSISNY